MKFWLTFFLTFFAVVSWGIVISDVTFTGLETVEASELLFLVRDYVNVDLTDQGVQELAKKIFDTGYFSSLEPELISTDKGYVLNLKVQENPVVTDWKIEVTGPELIKKDNLQSAVVLEKNRALSIEKVKESLQAIKKKFDDAGYFLVEVNGDFKEGVYIFQVIEYALWEIYFDGETDGLDFSQIRKQMKIDTLKDFYTTPSILRIFTKDIKRCYPTIQSISSVMSVLSKYVYFGEETSINFEKMDIPGVDEKAAALKINVSLRKIIDDGKVYDNVEIAGNKLISSSELQSIIKLQPGQYVSNVEILKAMQNLIDYYDEKGYPMVFVTAQEKENTLLLNVHEKYISSVEFDGLSLTKKYVIDDLITFEKGEALKEKDFYDTISALNRTQFFESISAYPVGTSDSTEVKVMINIGEKQRKFDFNGGIAWTPPSEGKQWYEGFYGEVTLATINPFGYGQSFSISGTLGLSSRSFSFEYSVRKPFELPATLGALFKYENTTDDSSVTNILQLGGNFTTLRREGHAFGAGVTYEQRYSSIGTENTLILSGNYSYDTRDNSIFAMNGKYLYTGVSKAGLFGILDDRSYWKLRVDARMFMPLYEDSLSVAFRAFATTLLGESYKISGATEETILFYGIDSVRGTSSVKDKAGWVGSAELRYDLKSQTIPIYLLAFVDVGGTGESLLQPSINVTAGPEMDIAIPMLGVIGFGVAYNFDGNWTFDNFKPFFRFGTAF